MTQFDEDQGAETPRLGRYEILGEIASGGMATVFLARAVGAGGFSRLMAIKRLHPHLESDDDFVRMFLDEARLAARIRHPNVVATLDVEDHDGLYIVMEYIEGVTLQQLTRSAQRAGERVPIPVAARIALDILAGLHAAHELRDEHDQFLNLVHRDVSPQNVLLGTDGAARLTDFGIAKAASRLSMTRDGQLKGKISYMAPEQTRRGEVDRRADVFAMGVVVWEVLAGRRLFSGETDVEVLNQLLFEPIPRLKDHAPSLPSMLEQTVMRALERDPATRYASAAQFGDALDRATRMLGGPANHRVVAAFIQKVAGERIARERGRISSGAPVSEAGTTGSYKALDANGLPSSRVRPSSAPPPSERGFDPMPPRPRSLRAPTMTGPVYAPDDAARTTVPPRAQRRPSPLRPPTMPSLGAPRRSEEGIDPFKSTLLGVGENASSSRAPGPPAIIEFDPSESQTVATMASPFPSAVRSRTPAPLGPNANTSIDHEAVTRLGPARQPPPVDTSEPGSEAATLSVPVSMLFGAPQGAPNFAPHKSTHPPDHPRQEHSAPHPPPLPPHQDASQQFAPQQQFAAQQQQQFAAQQQQQFAAQQQQQFAAQQQLQFAAQQQQQFAPQQQQFAPQQQQQFAPQQQQQFAPQQPPQPLAPSGHAAARDEAVELRSFVLRDRPRDGHRRGPHALPHGVFLAASGASAAARARRPAGSAARRRRAGRACRERRREQRHLRGCRHGRTAPRGLRRFPRRPWTTRRPRRPTLRR
ncbi:MAG: protein kinase [Polyangiales bacterium]